MNICFASSVATGGQDRGHQRAVTNGRLDTDRENVRTTHRPVTANSWRTMLTGCEVAEMGWAGGQVSAHRAHSYLKLATGGDYTFVRPITKRKSNAC